jgi:excisionase family DNA binding protein
MKMKVKEPAEGATHVPGYHTVAECARLLNISPAAVYNRIARSSIEVIKVGRTILLSDEAVLKLFTDVRHYQYHTK